MTDQDASPSSNLRPRRATKQQPDIFLPDRHDHAPTAISGQDHQVNTILPDGSLNTSDRDDDRDDNYDDASIPPDQRHPRSDHHPRADEGNFSSRGALRPHKNRTNGAFLLSDPVFGGGTHLQKTQLQPPKRQSLLDPNRNRITKHGLDRSPGRSKRTGPSNEVGLGLVQRSGSTATAEASLRQASSITGSTLASNRGSLAGETVVGANPPTQRTAMAPLDMESAQIVNMALNLSESRRIASRRIISQPVPPRLGPVPEHSTGGSLRQHLQQQRRVSRNMSPRPDHSPRIASARSLQAPADLEPYQYHFSQSTLARAQKAREYLGLMAQYRRILELLPPLKADRSVASSTVSPPLTPNGSNFPSRVPTNDAETIFGRPYNPLQYIRNRKIRARERKTLDGEGQGFNDVERVSEWVDEVAKWIAKGQDRVPGNPSIPPFTPARILSQENSPQSLGSRPTTAMMPKMKRPRVDWAVDPADMIADIYWLEQDDNRYLVEDRNWKRLFPQGGVEIYRSLSRDDTPGSSKIFSNSNSLTTLDKARTEPPPQVVEQKPVHKAQQEQPHGFSASRARDKAQQKLRALKGSHHRANSSIYNRDILRIHRGSFSESSDTDSDRKRRGRHGTISSSGKDILARQMEDMIAQEQRDIEAHPLYDQETQRLKLPDTGLSTPERDREKARLTPALNRANSVDDRRPASRSEPADLEGSYFKLPAKAAPAQVLAGRIGVGSLNGDRRFSTDYDTSPPYSPDLRPMHDVLVPGLGMDVSPRSTRPSSPMGSSPSRSRLTKVRSIFRDRSSEQLAELSTRSEKGENPESVQFLMDRQPVESPATMGSANGMLLPPERKASRSPLRKIVTKGTDSSQKSSKSTGNHKLREDGSSSLKGLFRGQRIDSVLRSGVSKVSDMLWRKETAPGPVDEYDSSDESDAESRGRSRSLPSSPARKAGRSPSNHGKANGEKSYLDIMPQFIPTAEKHHSKSKSVGGSIEQQNGLLSASPPSRPLSRRSSRFELLKPPKIDVQNASPTSSPGLRPLEITRTRGGGAWASDVSDVEGSRKSSVNTDAGGVREADARLNAMLTMAKDRQLSNASSAGHWSIGDRGENATPVPPHTIVSKREIARLRALLLSSGIHAMEIDRRAKARKLLNNSSEPNNNNSNPRILSWPDLVALSPDSDPSTRQQLLVQPVAQTDFFPLAANILSSSIQNSATAFQSSVAVFQTQTAPRMTNRVEALRSRISGELTEMTRRAAEEADDAGGDLMTHQRLKVKRVVDMIDRMVRRRRRRFRWVRRAGWLAVEWVLVGFMWYVWFVVMIARVFLGIGRGVVGVGRWLLWL
ncbi:hypothetical protein B0T20DRAFT_511712 [Sordaria brevicollis]|uniref:Uncharacterized protein n=1 Tax=Sordaria brevicollis TaxID=83679 RepID=A0AAE0NUZ2_SORBR|nr:hypothetical protein B0T20DRAFT_511712 [Sordaria brevicollis]